MAWQGPGCPGKTAECIRRFAGQPGVQHEVRSVCWRDLQNASTSTHSLVIRRHYVLLSTIDGLASVHAYRRVVIRPCPLGPHVSHLVAVDKPVPLTDDTHTDG